VAFAGSLPRAFSDMPRSWVGTLSSAEEKDEVREFRTDAEDCAGVCWSMSLSESSSEPPTAKVPSSGTSLREPCLLGGL